MGTQVQTAEPGKAATAKLQPRESKEQPKGPFLCGICGMKIARRSDMPRHLRSHVIGQCMHYCTFSGCHYKSLQKSNVTTHNFIHTDKKPLKCPDCSFENKHPASMLRHRKNYHGYQPKPRAQRQLTSEKED